MDIPELSMITKDSKFKEIQKKIEKAAKAQSQIEAQKEKRKAKLQSIQEKIKSVKEQISEALTKDAEIGNLLELKTRLTMEAGVYEEVIHGLDVELGDSMNEINVAKIELAAFLKSSLIEKYEAFRFERSHEIGKLLRSTRNGWLEEFNRFIENHSDLIGNDESLGVCKYIITQFPSEEHNSGHLGLTDDDFGPRTL